MATHLNTIKVPVNFSPSGTIADAVLTTIGTPTIYIAENSVTNPVVFKSVMLHIALRNMSTATGGTLAEFRADMTLNGASTTTFTELDDHVNTGENWGGIIGPIDFTAHFTANFGTVTSKTCAVQVYADISTGTGLTTNGVLGLIEITYEYNDVEPNRIMTIAYPLESNTGALPTTATNYGTGLPQLTGVGGLLSGYNTPVLRHAWVEVIGNVCNNAGTTDFNLSFSLDGGGATACDTIVSALATDMTTIERYNISGAATGSTHTLQLWSSLATRFHSCIVTVYYSYEYTVSGSTRVLNYIEVPVEFDSPIDGNSSAEAQRYIRNVLINEPGTITQKAIGIELSYSTGGTANTVIKAGTQGSFKTYTMLSSVVGGTFFLQHLMDSRSTLGSAITLTRGQNELRIDLYKSSGATYTATGIIRILYESDINPSGIDNHVKTVTKWAKDIDLLATGNNKVTTSFPIPETNYYLNSAFFEVNYWINASAVLSSFVEVNSGEGKADGWETLYVDSYSSDAELAWGLWRVRAQDVFKRYPTDPISSRLDIETSRRMRIASYTTFRFGQKWVVSYNSNTFTVSGNITGSTGGTVTLNLFDATTNTLYATTSRTGDGAYSFTVYDDVTQYYVLAYEDNTLRDMSQTAVPGSGFDINIGTGGGGEYYF